MVRSFFLVLSRKTLLNSLVLHRYFLRSNETRQDSRHIFTLLTGRFSEQQIQSIEIFTRPPSSTVSLPLSAIYQISIKSTNDLICIGLITVPFTSSGHELQPRAEMAFCKTIESPEAGWLDRVSLLKYNYFLDRKFIESRLKVVDRI